jgi:hypothetical protein
MKMAAAKVRPQCLRLVVALLLCAGGCVIGTLERDADGKITETEAIRIAKRKFQRLMPSELTNRRIIVVEDRENGEWLVGFEQLLPDPGGTRIIRVDQATGRPKVLPGM